MHPLLRLLLLALGTLAVGYIALLALLYFQQASLVFPGASGTRGKPFANVTPPAGGELLSLSLSDGTRIAALFAPAMTRDGSPVPEGEARPALLYFYGNGMCLANTLGDVERFRRLGADVLVAEFPGYGLSGGQASEAGCYAAADALYDYATTVRKTKPEQVVPVGWSLGGAVALDLASRRPVGALAVFSTFTGLVDMAERLYPHFPVRLLLRHRFESLRKIRSVQGPVLIGHGRQDETIPFTMAEQVAGAAPGPVTRLWIDGAGHNDFFDIAGHRVTDELARLLSRL